MSDQLLVAAQKIQRETGCSFVAAWGIAQSENPGLVQSTRASEKPIETIEATHTGRMSVVSGAAPTGGTSYPINDPDAANERLHETSNGPEKPRVDYSSGEKLLALAKQIQKSSGCSFTNAWLKAAAEHPEWTNQTPSGVDNNLDGITVTDVGPKTKAADPFPKLSPNPLSGTVTSVRTEDQMTDKKERRG
jgi:hypothetical protein